MTVAESWAASRWIVISGVLGAALAAWLSPALLPWLAPVLLPMMAAPLIIAWSSAPARSPLFQTPNEAAMPEVLMLDRQFRAIWQPDSKVVRISAA